MKTSSFKIAPKTLNLLKLIGQLADERGESAYAVGGFVRDLFLKTPGVDIDVTVEGDGLAFAEVLAKRTGSKVEAFTRFGTSIVIIPGFGKVDVATARTESYAKPGALPTVAQGGITQDLYRRDFTINAMALNLSPAFFLKLLDPFHGLEDLKKGRIRALHAKSFLDDPTRVFRAVRFEQRFQKHIEPETQKWLLASIKHRSMNTISGERLRNEFQLIFKEAHPEKAVWRLNELGVLPKVHPMLGLSKEGKRILPRIAAAIGFFREHHMTLEDEKMVWFQAILSKSSEKGAQALGKRLMLSRHEQKVILHSVKSNPAVLETLDQKNLTPSRMYQLLSPIVPEVRCFLLAAASDGLRRKMTDYLIKVQNLKPWVRGRDLQLLGIEPGFRYSFILLEVLNAQLDGRFKNRKQAFQWVRSSFAP
jgi:tRNA nucleotidyltransferase (CCA-adding enzyme)